MPRDWLMAAVAPLEMAIMMTIKNMEHCVTSPRDACTFGLIWPAVQMVMIPEKKSRYIISIWGQVKFQIAAGVKESSGFIIPPFTCKYPRPCFAAK